jgi:hypothetical protein
MLHFISSLFSSSGESAGKPDKDLVTRATDRAVDATDSRLRGFGNYRKRLYPAVEHAVIHIQGIVAALPEAIELSRENYKQDPRLRAFFVSAKHMQEVISSFKAVKDYLHDLRTPLPDEIFGTLSMNHSEKTVLGMDLSGDIVRRDVPQVQVNFSDHRYLGPSECETASRHELAIRGFDFLVEKVLENIISARSARSGLEQQRRLLQRKLDAMRAGNWGLEAMLAEEEHTHPDYAALEKDISEVDGELLKLGGRPDELEYNLAHISDILGNASELLSVREIEMAIDPMMVKKTDSSSDERTLHLKLNEASAKTGERRIIMLGRFPTRELQEQPDFLNEALRRLG